MSPQAIADLATQFRVHFETVAAGQALDEASAKEAFACVMRGGVSDLELAAFLVALKVRGETADEISGAVAAMREIMVPVTAPEGAIDVVGTGGDAKGTFNVSTATAFVVAGAGVPVAKHGNRAVSSKSGAADVLERLGVNLKMNAGQLAACFKQAGVAFLWAPNHHPAMRHAAPVRAALKLRTIFNLLGPLLNPAGTKRQLIGTYDARWLLPMADVMKRAGAIHVWVVHGADGMDELTTTGASRVAELKDGAVSTFEITPKDAGLQRADLANLVSASPDDNAAAMRALLAGKKGAFRDIVLLNSAAALIIAGKAGDLREGAAMASKSIDDGKAMAALDALIGASHELSEAEAMAVAVGVGVAVS